MLRTGVQGTGPTPAGPNTHHRSPMDYLHDRDRSLACLRQAVALMGKHSAVLDPIAYAVWYDYAAGGTPALKQLLDQFVASQVLISQEQMRELFLRHVAPPGGNADLDALARVMGLAQAVSDSTAQAAQANDQLGRSLSHFQARLDSPPEADSLGEAVQDMRQVSEQTSSSIQQVSALLAKHAAEMAVLRQELDQARQEAAVDGLTQVLNRRAFDRALQGCLQQMAAGGSQQASLLLLDVDHFKTLNDRFGHAFGDDVLRALGRALRTVVLPGDSVGRFGGDEFALLLRMHTPDAAQSLAERLRQAVASGRIKSADGQASEGVTISVGGAHAQAGDSALKWLQRADAALYEAKRLGRNRVHWG